jgi:hypothetical protein
MEMQLKSEELDVRRKEGLRAGCCRSGRDGVRGFGLKGGQGNLEGLRSVARRLMRIP